jgi:LysR family hydrogen peroxide-inducible transcriptional activator
MNLQQLEYIVAVDKFRHFAQAARSCGVAQSTLSALIQKLEAELGLSIFDRRKHKVYPTEAGAEIIAQAKMALYHAAQIEGIAELHRNGPSGRVRLGITHTAASCIVPGLFSYMSQRYPDMDISIDIADDKSLAERVRLTETDMAILTLPIEDESLEEIPIYKEQLIIYSSGTDRGREWKHVSGSIDDLIRIVDANGGHARIPESYTRYLTDNQKKNIRQDDLKQYIEVGLVIRLDFMIDSLVHILTDAVKSIMK